MNKLILGLAGLLLCFGFGNGLKAQTGVAVDSDAHLTDQPFQSIVQPKPAALRTAAEVDTPKYITLPFFDNFTTRDFHPDTNRWFENAAVYVARSGSVRPPDYGTAVFDGRNDDNFGYSVSIVKTGYADSLTTHKFDLSKYSIADSLYLSFFYQPAGLGDAPEPGDSLEVLFRVLDSTIVKNDSGADSTVFAYPYRMVWLQRGDSLRDYRQAMIPLNDSAYFHKNFQIRFQNRATLNGMYDLWFLDYVYFNKGRSAADTIYHDAGIQKINRSFFSGLTALPYEHFVLKNQMSPFEITVNNLNDADNTQPLVTSIYDYKTNTLLGQQAANVAAAPFASDTVSYSAFNEISLSRSTYIRNTALLTPAPNDTISSNDSYYVDFSAENYIAYDDGEAEGGYGIRDARGFGQLYQLYKPDSIIGVYMAFVPRNEVFPGDRFLFTIWDATDSSKISPKEHHYQKSLFLSWGTQPNNMVYFPLKDTVDLPQKFIAGIVQINSKLIGVGYDRDYANRNYVYWDSSDVFVKSRLDGTLMIRPVLRSGYSLAARNDVRPATTPALTLYPNPTNGAFYLNADSPAQWIAVAIFDLTGRTIAQSRVENPVFPIQPFGQLTLPPGVYHTRIETKSAEGNVYQTTKKLVVAQP